MITSPGSSLAILYGLDPESSIATSGLFYSEILMTTYGQKGSALSSTRHLNLTTPLFYGSSAACSAPLNECPLKTLKDPSGDGSCSDRSPKALCSSMASLSLI